MVMRRERALIVLLLLWCQVPQCRAVNCPPPFSWEGGLCVFASTSQSFSWCAANQQCASVSGELLNSYESVRLLKNGTIGSATCACQLWIGLAELADYRGKKTSGWQRVNGNGIFPDDNKLLDNLDASYGQVCLRRQESGRIADMSCDEKYGFVCEFVAPPPQSDRHTWVKAEINRVNFNLPNSYCFTDLAQVPSELHCVQAGILHGNCREVLFNKRLRTCRLLQFSDALMEREVATSDDWVKYRLM